MTKSSAPTPARAREIMDMLATIPADLLRQRTVELLGATRHVSMGRDRDAVVEPDNQVRLRVLELVIEQGAGSAGSRPPAAIDVAPVADKPTPGLLRRQPIPATPRPEPLAGDPGPVGP